MRFPRCLVPLAGLALAAAPAVAQDVPARLTLEDAMRIARSHDPQFLQTLNDEELARIQERESWMRILPQPSGRISSNLGWGQGNRSSSSSQSLQLNATLFDGGQSINGLRAAWANARAVDARIEQAELQMRQRVAGAFYGALQRQRAVQVSRELLARAQADSVLMDARAAVGGRVGREDMLGLRLQILNQQDALRDAEANARKARLELLRQIGVQGEVDFELEGSIPEVFDPRTLDVDSLIAEALAGSPRIRQEREALRQQQLNAQSTRWSAWLPRVTASARLSGGASEFFDLNPRRAFSADLGISLPFLDFLGNSQRIARANLNLEDARYQAEQVRLAVETDVRTALIDLIRAYEAVERADQRLAISNERLELTRQRYRGAAGATFIELQTAISEASNAERSVIDARLTFVTQLLALETAVGREVNP